MPYTCLVLDRPDCIVGDFDRVRAPGQSQCFRPERDATKYHAPAFPTMLSAIDAAMCPSPPDGMFVVAPNTVTVDQCALPRTIGEVFDSGNRNDGLDIHSRSAP